MSALFFLKDVTVCEEYALRKGFLQSLDPRIKMVTFLMFLLTVVFLKSALLIGCVYLFCLLLALCSRVPLPFFLVRTWVFIPLFSLGIVIPALFSGVTPGETAWSFHVLGANMVITHPGLDGAVLFVARVATSVSLVVLLSLTTRHMELLRVLRVLGLPQIFVLTVSMCYRYLYLFAVMVENIFIAIKSRVGMMNGCRKGQRVVAWNIANMWNRTAFMSEEVYKAMLSRGYTGEPKLLHGFKSDIKDKVWLLCAFIVCAGLFYAGYHL